MTAADEVYTGPPPTRRPEPWQIGQLRPSPWAAPGPLPGYGPVPVGGPWGPTAPPPWAGSAPPAPPVRWDPPPGTPPHDEPQPFLHAMRSRTWVWWRPLAGLALLTVVYTVAAVVVVLIAVVTGITPDLALLDLVDPATLLVTNLSLILFVPAVWLAWTVAHGMGMGWSASVLARLRPRLLLPYTLMALVTLGPGIVLAIGMGALLDTGSITGPVPQLGWLFLVVFLTTPLQSAAEEYLFRGYLSQAVAGWFRSHRAGAIVAGVLTAAVFSLAHAPPDFLTFLDRFVFALAASATVWLTGGLEAAIVLHAVNNVVVFVLAGLLGDGVATQEVPQGTGAVLVLITMLTMGAYVALVARTRGRLRPELRTAAQDLRPLPAGGGPRPGPSWAAAPLPTRSTGAVDGPGRASGMVVRGAERRRASLGVWGNWQPG